jgi:hypothetical protein
LELELVRSLSDAEGTGLGVSETGSRPTEISESASDYYQRLSKESGLTQP